MKSIIFGLALIAVVACDVSHLQGQGWSKDENGYNYPKPATRFEPEPEVVADEIVEAAPELEIIADEPVGCVNGGSGPFCCINGADNEDCVIAEAVVAEAPVADAPVVEVTNDYLPPVTNDYLPPVNNEYLPPAEALKLRKRQVLARRQQAPQQVRRVYRRVYRRL